MSDRLIEADVVATEVSFEAYLEKYAHDFYEWVGGNVMQTSPIHDRHDVIAAYLRLLFRLYFKLRPIGRVRQAPFLMHLPAIEVSREPDVQVILDENPHEYTATYMKGPADLAIEVVSPESEKRDYEIKRAEYEAGGGREYWIVDPMKKECLFLLRDDEGKYQPQAIDERGVYMASVLPDLRLKVDELWLPEEDMPDPVEVQLALQRMLNQDGQE
jgi:Uma2 family endonuclease